jgi:hypothetical protein
MPTKRGSRAKMTGRAAPPDNQAYAAVVAAFARDRSVTRELRKGFGSGALKVKGKIFAMTTSTGEFVVKLPKARVDELVAARSGTRFDPGHGRVMKEWLTVDAPPGAWIDLAREAHAYVRGASGKQ